MSLGSKFAIHLFFGAAAGRLLAGPNDWLTAAAALSAAFLCWRMLREIRSDVAYLERIEDETHPLYGCPHRSDPRYAHIDPLKVLKKRWDLMTDLDKDIDYWMRCHALQERLEINGDFEAASKLRARYEEVMQEEHDLEHRSFPATGAGR